MAVIARKCPGIRVTVVDVDRDRIAAWNSERLPVYERGLDELVRETRGKNLFFSAEVDAAIRQAQLIFICVNTPTKDYGQGRGKAADLVYVERCARRIAEQAERGTIVVEKSTVPVRTAEMIQAIMEQEDRDVQVLSNPEFMAEGTAIEDLNVPDRVLIGSADTPAGRVAAETLAGIYRTWVDPERIILTGIWSSELSKLSANAFLAQKISSINALSALCEATQADVTEVANAVGRDERIGPRFLRASVGFGGSCFKKDLLNLIYLCEHYGLSEVAAYWQSVLQLNEYQKTRFANQLVRSLFNTVTEKKIAIFGFAFKQGTNDVRESPAITVCRQLLTDRAWLGVYDPAVPEASVRQELSDVTDSAGGRLEVFSDPYDACDGSHALVILTEWNSFRDLDFRRIFASMRKPAVLFDGRNLLDIEQMRRLGFQVRGVGKV